MCPQTSHTGASPIIASSCASSGEPVLVLPSVPGKVSVAARVASSPSVIAALRATASIGVFAGAQEDLVTADARFLREAHALLRQTNALSVKARPRRIEAERELRLVRRGVRRGVEREVERELRGGLRSERLAGGFLF